MLDAHDREAVSWVGVAGRGIGGSDIRDMMLDAVEKRFAVTSVNVVENLV